MNTTLSLHDLASIAPLLIILIGALFVLLVESWNEQISKRFSFYLTLGTLIIALYAACISPASQNALLTSWIRFDSLARFFTLLFIAIGLGSILLSYSFFQDFDPSRGEYFFLLLSSIAGLILIGSAADFLTLFLGLETLSIPLYVLCGYMKKWGISKESSFKYFLMGSLATAFMLYGIAFIYGATGTTRLDVLLGKFQELSGLQERVLFLSGIALITLGFAFKAAIVPFHVWAPDVYAGAPTPVTAFMATGTKAGAFAAFAVVFLLSLPRFDVVWNQAIALLAYPTLIYANYLAIRQTQLRRFFAYSGISHAGFLLIPLAAGTPEALPALKFYLVVYALATLGSFAVLACLDKRSEGVTFDDLKGLFRRSPLLAGSFALCLLTLAGIPPTAGFFAKFYVFMVAFQAGYYGLVVVGLLTTILSAYYYLRIIAIMLAESEERAELMTCPLPIKIVGVVTCFSILFLSIYPAPLFDLLMR